MKQQQRAAFGAPSGFQAAWATVSQAWFTPIAVVLGIFDVVAAVLVIADPNGKMPGQVIGPIFLVGFASRDVHRAVVALAVGSSLRAEHVRRRGAAHQCSGTASL